MCRNIVLETERSKRQKLGAGEYKSVAFMMWKPYDEEYFMIGWIYGGVSRGNVEW